MFTVNKNKYNCLKKNIKHHNNYFESIETGYVGR